MTERPVVEQRGDAYVFRWPGMTIHVEIDNIIETRGEMYAELIIADAATNDDSPDLIHNSRLNLNAATTRSSLARTLEQMHNGLPWPAMLEQVCFLTKQMHREGAPIINLREYQAPGGDRWLLRPYLEAEPGSMSVIYADGGTGKSVAAMAMAITIAGTDAILGSRIGAPRHVLYLDWEAGAGVQQQRMRALCAGAGWASEPQIHYQPMRVPLVSAAANLRRKIAERHIGVVFIDSLGAAADGPIEESATALATCQAIRSLQVPVLAVHHRPKNVDGRRGAGAMFGSVYYANATRIAWEMEAAKDEGSQTIAVQLVNTKNNNGMLERRHAFRIQFANDAFGIPEMIRIKGVDIADVSEFAARQPLRDRIMAALRDGAMDRNQLAAELDIKVNHASKELSELKRQGKVVALAGNRWGRAG